MSKVEDFIVGAGIGSLVGLLIGLSTASVVGTAISAIAAILAAALGLTKVGNEHVAQQRARLTGFGVFATVALLAGLLLRVQDLMAPNVSDKVIEWQDAGYTKEQALAYAAFETLGIKPADTEVIAPPKSSTVLSSSKSNSHCNSLILRNRSSNQWISAAKVEESPWPQVANIVETSPENSQQEVIKAIWRLLCEK